MQRLAATAPANNPPRRRRCWPKTPRSTSSRRARPVSRKLA
ncbi:hypothetical protein I553_9472 [Mycobacterium xenopi 4042]|uniref:Uncharacterized protein n=1 Tax=Mycobacterium xenopi 4042 TaxID=1299334 RepID=X8DZD3_MYCXE|nr:hypothetical protein I553_9472 [Mycobacterium xenopi 4042]